MAVLCATAGAACAAFSSAPEAPAGGEAEGGGGGGGAEASVDLDARALDASRADAAPEDASPFCAAVDAQFCWSFDAVQLPLLGPSLTIQATGASPTVVDAALSPPRAMAAALVAPGNMGVNLNVGRDVSHLRCELELFFERTQSLAADEVAIFQLDYMNSNFVLPVLRAKKVNATTLRVALNYAGAADVDLGNVPVSEWVHASIDTDIVAGTWQVRARMLQNDEGTLDAGARAKLPRFNRVFFGLATLATSIDWRVRYDNFVCYWQ